MMIQIDTQSTHQPLGAPPTIGFNRIVPTRVVVPNKTLARSKNSDGSLSSSKSSEKTGRWTDEEHSVFLQGLEQHGKQWKMIATMIGTRTVVQVRTHAQKYFQKMERKNNPVQLSPVPKRKSLPASLPSRSKKTRSPKKPRISISLTNVTEALPVDYEP
jgi:SHAQKYF class myb-like DNA-binding protein